MMKKLLKKLSLVAIVSLTFVTLQAQTPIVHMEFEGDLTNSGTEAIEFELINETGVAADGYVLYTDTGFEGTGQSLNYSANFDPSDYTNSDYLGYGTISNNVRIGIKSKTNSSITGSAARTVSGWIKQDLTIGTLGANAVATFGPESAGNYERCLFGIDTNADHLLITYTGGRILSEYDGKVQNVEGAAGGYDIETTIEDGNWHHIAFTYESGGTLNSPKFYIDGIERPVTFPNASVGDTQVMTTVAAKVSIGMDNDFKTKWQGGGSLDDVRIYDVALSSAQILALYNGTLSTEDFAFGELKAYPNAVEDFLHIETTSRNPLHISVFDLSGRNVIRTYGDSVNMSDLSSGMYIVKVREDNKVADLKILKK